VRFQLLQRLFSSLKKTTARFPYSMICALVACGLGIFIAENDLSEPEVMKLLMSIGLGVPLFLSIDLFGEARGLTESRALVAVRLLAWIFIAGFFYYALSEKGSIYYLRYAQASLICHLSVAFAPFLGRGSQQGFWQFNRRLFLRICLSFLYASVFFLGLALALASSDFLFGVSLHGKLYFDLWCFSAMVLQTLHFLAGVPEDFPALDNDPSFPPALKIFTQYLLLPLVVLYSAILYAYFIKVGWQQNWPKGYVGWLVAGESVFGVFCLLLLHPLFSGLDGEWLAKFRRLLYIAMPPLLVMLFIATAKRINEYGLTERRYLLIALGVWLWVLCFYFLFSKGKNIKAVPLSLAFVALATSFGPWGAYSLSLSSQLKRLMADLESHVLLVNGKFSPSKTGLNKADRDRIAAALDYLCEAHSAEVLRPWIDPGQWSAVEAGGAVSRYDYSSGYNAGPKSQPALIMQILGLEYKPEWTRSHPDGGMNAGALKSEIAFNAEDAFGALELRKYKWAADITSCGDQHAGKRYLAFLNLADSSIYLTGPDLKAVRIELQEIAASLVKAHAGIKEAKVPQDDLVVEGKSHGVSYRLVLSSLRLDDQGNNLRIASASGKLLFIP
jgi:hypothetical protein